MRFDRYDKSEKHDPEKSRRSKWLPFVVIIVLFAAVAFELWTLLTITSIDRRFTRSVERGLYAGWNLDTDEMQMQAAGRITDTGFIDAEYDAVSEYMGRKYKDDKLADIARQYTSALKDCRKASRKYDPVKDFDKFWAAFSKPYGARIRALYKLQSGDYGFDLNVDDYPEESEYLLSQGWLLETVSGLKFSSSEKDGIRTFEARVRNDSGSDIQYLNIDVELLDKSGKRAELSSVYLTNINAGDMMHLQFISSSEKAARYRIVSETVKFGGPAEES